MTDRGRAALSQSRDTLRIGPSAMIWRDGRLEIEIDEVSSLPLVSRMRGRITVTPAAMTDVELPLTPDCAHIWRPFAPAAHISVDLEASGWRWDGHGYFDANFGTRALEDDFRRWTWARFPAADGGATAFYDALRRDGSTLSAAFRFDPQGNAGTSVAPPAQPIARTGWLLRRQVRCDPGHAPRQVRSMLDAPFYARAGVETVLQGARVTGVHEELDLDRFASPWLKPMLAVRVPRRSRWPGGQA